MKNWLDGGGEMGALIRAHEWAETPLGLMEDWPPSLKTALSMLLVINLPAALAWGPELVLFTNHAWLRLCGPDMRSSLFAPLAAQAASGIWSALRPGCEQLMAGSAPMRHENRLITIERRGRVEDVHWTYSQSPVADADTTTGVGGVLTLVSEADDMVATLRAADERQLFLSKLNDTLRPLSDPREIMFTAAAAIGRHLGVVQVGYAEADPPVEFLTVEREWNDGSVPSNVGPYRLARFGHRLSADLKRGCTMAIGDVACDVRTSSPEALASFARISIAAFVYVPLIKGGRLAAVLVIHSHVPRLWSADDVKLAEEVAERTWAAVERARAETALRESEARFRLMADAVPQLVWITDAEGGLEFVNRPWANYVGVSCLPATASDVVTNYIHPDDVQRTMDVFGATRTTGSVLTVENRLRGKDGNYRWFLVRAEPYLDEVTGKVIRWFGTSTDIEDRKREETLTLEREERQALLLKLSDALRLLGDAEQITFAACQTLGRYLDVGQVGYAEMDASGEFVTGFAAWTNGEVPNLAGGRFRMADFGNFVFDIRETAAVVIDDVELDERTSAPDHLAALAGIRIAAGVGLPLIKARGFPALLYVTNPKPRHWSEADVELIRDIAERTWAAVEQARAETALSASEKRWHGLFERMHEGFTHCEIVFGPDGEPIDYVILETNAAWLRLVGRPKEEVRGRRVSEIVPDLEPYWVETFARVVQTGEAVDFEWEFATLGLWFEAMAYHTEPGRFAALFRDITKRKRAEKRQAFLLKLSDALRPLADPMAIEGEACRLLAQELGVSRVFYMENGAKEDSVVVAQDFVSGGGPSVVGEHLLSDFAWVTQHFDRGQNVVLADARTSEMVPASERGRLAFFQILSACNVPLAKNGRWVGALTAADAAPRAWAGADIQLVQETAERIWDSIERARAEAALRESESRLQVLVHELQHRTRNLMGVVRSTASKTLKASSDLADFDVRFQSRIDALARVQGLLSRLDEYERVTFDELIRTELQAMGAPGDAVLLDGPSKVRLRSSAVQMLAMAMHELATNALKYGALGQPRAQLSILWRVEQDPESGAPWLRIEWKETGVEMPEPSSVAGRRGQGRELIERAMPYQLSARTSFELGDDGICCTIELPISIIDKQNVICG